jgi:RHS repeat-associated protein
LTTPRPPDRHDATTYTSTLLRDYVCVDGKAVGMVENDVFYFVRTDHIGRPVFATDDTATVQWIASYKPFGSLQTSTGNPIELRFPGQWYQSESGLHQNWMREYDPTTGRYLQADPLGLVDGPSVYGYALQNPGRYVDPRGNVEFNPRLLEVHLASLPLRPDSLLIIHVTNGELAKVHTSKYSKPSKCE